MITPLCWRQHNNNHTWTTPMVWYIATTCIENTHRYNTELHHNTSTDISQLMCCLGRNNTRAITTYIYYIDFTLAIFHTKAARSCWGNQLKYSQQTRVKKTTYSLIYDITLQCIAGTRKHKQRHFH